MSFTPEQIQAALKHLKRSDPVMRKLIRDVGPFTLRPNRNHFRMLIRSIISQQISTKVARSIRLRVESLVKPKTPTAKNLVKLSDETLRSAGLSPQKTRYLRDLCEHVLDDRLRLRRLGNLPDEEVITELIQVKGIGLWTAQMFLMFSLGRLDILPHDDLGIRSAIRHLYDLDELPGKETCHQIAEPWRPYATVASWYCWRSGDLEKNEQISAAEYPV
jgi:DNA-3-methyladenine glycosylase II